MEAIGVGLIGYGFAGATFHAPLITAVPGLQLRRIASSQADKVQRAFPHLTADADPASLIAAAEVDLVVISTPNTVHHSLAKQALLAGKHVVLEKPFTVTAAEAHELVQLAATQGRMLSAFHNRRWDNDFLTLQHCIASGQLGPIHTYQAHFDRFRPHVQERWREQALPGSGALYDLGSHLIDQALTLFGAPLSISADIAMQRLNGHADDYFHLRLEYAHTKVILHCGSMVLQPGPRYQVHGRHGSFMKFGLDPQEDMLKQGRSPGDAGWGCESAELYPTLTTENDGARRIPTLAGHYQGYYEGVRDAIAFNQPPPVTASQALMVIQVIECALDSNAQRRVLPFAPL